MECPERVESILEAFKDIEIYQIDPTPCGDYKHQPANFGIDPIIKVHGEPLFQYLQTAYDKWIESGLPEIGVLPDCFPHRNLSKYFDHSAQNPLSQAGEFAYDCCAIVKKGTFQAAYWASQCVLAAAHNVLYSATNDKTAFAITRPPGHHAFSHLIGGFCYFNHAAIAAEYILSHPSTSKVLILDVDYHHGNGTQDMFYERSDVLYISLHAKDDYPYYSGMVEEKGHGQGMGYNVNVPLTKSTNNEDYVSALEHVLNAHSLAFKPDAFIVSLGLDTFHLDPVGGFQLTFEAYPEISKVLKKHVGLIEAKINKTVPVLFVMEGGYHTLSLGANVRAVLSSFL